MLVRHDADEVVSQRFVAELEQGAPATCGDFSRHGFGASLAQTVRAAVDCLRLSGHIDAVSSDLVANTDSPALECVDLIKRYPDGTRDVMALRKVSLSVARGSCVALRGTSGCGKTTLLSVLGGMVPPTSGEVRVLGRSITHLRDRHRSQLRRTEVGFVFQELALVPELSVEENVFLPLVPDGGPSAEVRKRTRAQMERIGLLQYEKTIAKKLSGGERQRVAILRALVLDPPILLLDEPTAHLDEGNTASLLTWLGTLREERTPRTTLVITTHDPRVLSHALVGRVIAMSDGAIAEDSNQVAI